MLFTSPRTVVLFAACLIWTAAAAWGHDMWIEPSDFAPAADQPVAVALVIGHAGESEPVRRNPDRIVRFAARGPSGELPIVGRAGQAPAGHVRPPAAGAWALVYESTPAYSELDAARFAAYLEEEGLDAVLRARAAAGTETTIGRERYSRSLKSLLTVVPADASTDALPAHVPTDAPVGLPLEIVLRAVTPSGDASTVDARVDVLWQGRPLAAAHIDAQPLGGGDGLDPRNAGQRTDADGAARLALAPGDWLVTVVHAIPATGDEAEGAEWRTYFASLTFRLGAGSRPTASDGR